MKIFGTTVRFNPENSDKLVPAPNVVRNEKLALHCLETAPSASVSQLQQRLQASGLVSADARLAFGGKLLREEIELQDCGLQDGSTVDALLPLIGGGGSRRKSKARGSSVHSRRNLAPCPGSAGEESDQFRAEAVQLPLLQPRAHC